MHMRVSIIMVFGKIQDTVKVRVGRRLIAMTVWSVEVEYKMRIKRASDGG